MAKGIIALKCICWSGRTSTNSTPQPCTWWRTKRSLRPRLGRIANNNLFCPAPIQVAPSTWPATPFREDKAPVSQPPAAQRYRAKCNCQPIGCVGSQRSTRCRYEHDKNPSHGGSAVVRGGFGTDEPQEPAEILRILPVSSRRSPWFWKRESDEMNPHPHVSRRRSQSGTYADADRYAYA